MMHWALKGANASNKSQEKWTKPRGNIVDLQKHDWNNLRFKEPKEEAFFIYLQPKARRVKCDSKTIGKRNLNESGHIEVGGGGVSGENPIQGGTQKGFLGFCCGWAVTSLELGSFMAHTDRKQARVTSTVQQCTGSKYKHCCCYMLKITKAFCMNIQMAKRECNTATYLLSLNWW